MKSYPRDLFDKSGRLRSDDLSCNRRMSANPHTNGGLLLVNCSFKLRDYACGGETLGAASASETREAGSYATMKLNMESRNFRPFSPDENNSTAGRMCRGH
jgi:xylulose-5-phosphate/fructose-6-phosphate phosphoketolase